MILEDDEGPKHAIVMLRLVMLQVTVVVVVLRSFHINAFGIGAMALSQGFHMAVS